MHTWSKSRTDSAELEGCSKRPSSKAAAREEARHTLRYVEPLSKGRTPLAGFFNSLLGSLVLLETTSRASLPWDFHLIGPSWEHILLKFRIEHLEFQEVGSKFLGN